MNSVADRLARRLRSGSADPGGYKFEAVKRAKARARAARPDLALLDFGVGEPDRPAASQVVETLASEAGRAENRYYADNGIPEFQQAAARYLGGEVHELPLTASTGFLPDLSSLPPEVVSRTKLLCLKYPHNPTGACATPGFFAEVVAWARRHRVIVVHDVAYAAVKDNCDSGQFRAIQKAAVKPAGTFYCYVPIPSGTRTGVRFADAAAFSPGDENAVLADLQGRLAALQLVFSKDPS